MKTILTAIFILSTLSLSAQLGSVGKLSKKDSTLSSTYFVPVTDSVTKKAYKVKVSDLAKSINIIDTATGTPPVAKIVPNTFKAFKNPANDSVFIWINIGGTVRRID